MEKFTIAYFALKIIMDELFDNKAFQIAYRGGARSAFVTYKVAMEAKKKGMTIFHKTGEMV